MSTNFQELLNKRADSFEAPKQLPPGKYQVVVKNFNTGESTQKKTPYVEFIFQVVGLLDVAPENSVEASAAVSSNAEVKTTFYLTEKSAYRLVEFLEKDLGMASQGRTLADMLPNSLGAACAVVMDKATTKDGKEFIEVKRTSPL